MHKLLCLILYSLFIEFASSNSLRAFDGVTDFKSWSIQEACDLPGKDLKNLSLQSTNACVDRCKVEAQCKAVVFVSGWNRCFLKTEKPKNFMIHFYSAGMKFDGDRKSSLSIAKDSDNRGKDLRKVANVKDENMCAKQCIDEKQCLAFTYISGYQDCWLKKNDGGNYQKIFYCATR